MESQKRKNESVANGIWCTHTHTKHTKHMHGKYVFCFALWLFQQFFAFISFWLIVNLFFPIIIIIIRYREKWRWWWYDDYGWMQNCAKNTEFFTEYEKFSSCLWPVIPCFWDSISFIYCAKTHANLVQSISKFLFFSTFSNNVWIKHRERERERANEKRILDKKNPYQHFYC